VKILHVESSHPIKQQPELTLLEAFIAAVAWQVLSKPLITISAQWNLKISAGKYEPQWVSACHVSFLLPSCTICASNLTDILAILSIHDAQALVRAFASVGLTM